MSEPVGDQTVVTAGVVRAAGQTRSIANVGVGAASGIRVMPRGSW